MSKVLVIGGAGYIGSHTVVELVAAGYEPVIVDNFSNSSRPVLSRLTEITGRDIPFYELDFQDESGLRAVFAKEKIEAVIHFAAYKAVGESVANPLKYYKNNTVGFVNLLALLIDIGVQTIVFSSTAAVYGTPPGDSVDEESPCSPESPYGWSKYMDEIILRDTCIAAPSLKGIALRYFNVVGAHESGDLGEHSKDRPQNLLPVIVQATAGLTPPLTVFGTNYPTTDGTCLRDYIHVTDLAKAHIAALEKASHTTQPFVAYNIGTGKPTSVLELIQTFEQTNGVKVPYELGERRAGDPIASYAIATKAKTELSWKADKNIKDACRDAWRWQTQHPKGYEA